MQLISVFKFNEGNKLPFKLKLCYTCDKIFCGIVTQAIMFVLINHLTQPRHRIASNYCQIIECCRDVGFLKELEYPLGEEMMPGVRCYTAYVVFKKTAILIVYLM